MEHAHPTHSYWIFLSSIAELAGGRRLRSTVERLAQILGVPAAAGDVPLVRLGHVSGRWLRQHDVEREKHRGGR